MVSEYFFFSNTHVDFLETIDFKELENKRWIRMSSNKDVDLLRIITKKNTVWSNTGPLKHLKLNEKRKHSSVICLNCF